MPEQHQFHMPRKIDVNNRPVRSLQTLLLLFLKKQDDYTNKNEKFYNIDIKKVLATINDMAHQISPGMNAGNV